MFSRPNPVLQAWLIPGERSVTSPHWKAKQLCYDVHEGYQKVAATATMVHAQEMKEGQQHFFPPRISLLLGYLLEGAAHSKALCLSESLLETHSPCMSRSMYTSCRGMCASVLVCVHGGQTMMLDVFFNVHLTFLRHHLSLSH